VTRKPFVRRRGDRAQFVRRSFQAAFLLLNFWIGAQFYLFVRHYESGGTTVAVPRPPGVEGWLPIAGLMNLKFLLVTGTMPEVHPAGLFLLLAFVGISVAFRKAFCSWLCPVGTISEWLWQGGRALFGRNVAPPHWVDVPLRGLKYLLLGFFAWAIAGMPADALDGFMKSPYGLLADVKMLDFFRDLGTVGAAAILLLVVSSVFVKNAWCRYLCPYGALLGLAALPSPVRIRRDPDACIDCAKCAVACPSLIPVDRLLSVKTAECTGCLECVAACPARGALDLTVARRRPIPLAAAAVGIALIFVAFVGLARVTGHWHTSLPDAVYNDLVPRARSFTHPGM
jgi:polyferredoxin